MKPRVIIISKKIVIAVVLFIVLAGLFKISDNLASQLWNRQIFTPGLEGKTVIIDPGHGGADPGAIAGKVQEADVNMDLAVALKKQLELKGVKVKMTRQDNIGLVPEKSMTYFERWLILEKRKNYALTEKGHILISIHANSSKDPSVSGGIVYYSDEKSVRLARELQNQLNTLGPRKREAEQSRFTIIKGNIMPSVLVETGFITNKHDRKILISQQNIVVNAVLKGLEKYAAALESPANGGTEEQK
ncbi:MAG: hypothetical protein CVV03_05060 [Firmicutes bacterium HGW-Firmicutes-8]|nr:MAG: hypothetical protein CVV03_05060 [Firmicutes bacterium HGW-Firmicutes-8]